MEQLFYGNADLHIENYINAVSAGLTCNLKTGQFNIHFDQDQATFAEIRRNFKEFRNIRIELNNISINFPMGKLSKPTLKDLVFVSYSPGPMSIFDGVLNRNLNVFGNAAGVSVLTLETTNSSIEFNFETQHKSNLQYELWFDNSEIGSVLFSFECNKQTIAIRSDSGSLVASSTDDLSALADHILYTWSIIQGQSARYLMNLKKDKLILYISPSFPRKSIGRIYAKYDDIPKIFIGTMEYLLSLSEPENHSFRRFIDIYLEAKANASDLNNRVVFTFLLYESLRGESGDDKEADETVSTALGITKREAAVIRFTRNRYIHHGSNLGTSVCWAHDKAIALHSSDKDRFFVDSTDLENTGLMFYIQVIMFVETALKGKFGLSTEFNEYQYEIQKSQK